MSARTTTVLARLGQRHRRAGAVGQGHIVEVAEVFSLAALGTGHHRHGAVALAHFGDRVTAEQRVELGLDLVRRKAQQAQAILVQDQAITAGALAPIKERVVGQPVGGDDVAHIFGYAAQHIRIRAGHAKHHRKRYGRAEQQLGDAHPRRREFAGGNTLAHAQFQRVACVGVGGLHDQFGERRVGHFRVQ
jgi:hypothetical protein